MSAYAVTAIGRDRAGIVAAITAALLELEGNVQDSQMSNLGGNFAVMLLVSVPDKTDADAISSRLEAVRSELSLDAVSVNPVSSDAAGRDLATHVLAVYGADHPGIVHAIATALADEAVNITDLETRSAGTPESPVYVMQLEVSMGAADPRVVEQALERTAAEAGVEVTLRELGADAL